MTFFYVIAVLLFSHYKPDTLIFDFEQNPTENQAFFRSLPAELLAVPPAQEPYTFNFTTAKYQNSGFQFNEFSACIKNIEQAGSAEYLKYVFLSANFPVKLRKADLLYPFHYFL